MSAKKIPGWVEMNEKGLRGGICVAGSVGSGKSVATLLPWVDQLLDFDPRPSFFIGDPKCTFAEGVIDLVIKKGLEDHLLHVTLGGSVKTNPIFRADMLRDGKFGEVGQMIRMAQINFMGKESGDSKFWGMKANDLVKNVLRFCAGAHGEYFTLIDFYKVLVEADQRDFETEISTILKTKHFDREQRANLEFCFQYFRYEYTKMDEKIKSGVASTATTFLSQLMEYQASQILCPKREDITFQSFDEILDSGKILVVDIRNEGLAKAMVTIFKQQYQASVLRRYSDPSRSEMKNRNAVTVIDEYPVVATVGSGEGLGDDTYRATARGAGAIDLIAMQGHTSLYSSVGDREACETLLLNYRTHITLHSIDSKTTDFFSRIGGEIEIEKENESFSESGKNVATDIFSKEAKATDVSVTRTLNKQIEKKKRIRPETLSRLNTFEAVGIVFEDGIRTKFYDDICLKPSFLEKRNTSHKQVLEKLSGEKEGWFKKVSSFVSCLILFMILFPSKSFAIDFPSICSVINTPQFEKIMDFKTSFCMCPGTPPYPCTRFSYYLPYLYIEVREDSNSLFSSLPGAKVQQSKFGGSVLDSGGFMEESGYFYNVRTLGIPFTSFTLGRLPCGGGPKDKMCFDAASEDLGKMWKTPHMDHSQPSMQIWAGIGPKACHLKGSAESVVGSPSHYSPGGPTCSFKMEGLPAYPPSRESVCTGWGQVLPRTGFVDASSSLNGSLLAAARFKSIASEVFQSSPSHMDEKWQMIHPNSSSDFRKGQNLGVVALSGGNERGRAGIGKEKGYVYAVWKKMSCCKDVSKPIQAAGVYAFAKSFCGASK